MNEVLSKKQSEVVLSKFAKKWSRATYFEYENKQKQENDKISDQKRTFEILDFFKKEFGLNSIEELLTK